MAIFTPLFSRYNALNDYLFSAIFRIFIVGTKSGFSMPEFFKPKVGKGLIGIFD